MTGQMMYELNNRIRNAVTCGFIAVSENYEARLAIFMDSIKDSSKTKKQAKKKIELKEINLDLSTY